MPVQQTTRPETESVSVTMPSATDVNITCTSGIACLDAVAPLSIRGMTIRCGVYLRCQPNSFFHLACEGFSRNIRATKLQKVYVCTLCRSVHPAKKTSYVKQQDFCRHTPCAVVCLHSLLVSFCLHFSMYQF